MTLFGHEIRLTARWFINKVGILLTSIIVIYGLIQISSSPVTTVFMWLFGAFVEIETQYIWGMSFTYQAAGKWVKALLLKAVCIGYVFIGVLLAVGFFALEIDRREVSPEELQQAKLDRQIEINQINRHIDLLLQQAGNETDKFGPRAREIEALIMAAKADRDKLKKTPLITRGNVFTALGKILQPLGITEGLLKFVIFGYCVFMIYLGVMLTPWNVPLVTISGKNVTSNKVVTPPKARNVTPRYTVKPPPAIRDSVPFDPEKYDLSRTCVCGCGKPPEIGRASHSGACRTRMSRRKAEGKRVLV